MRYLVFLILCMLSMQFAIAHQNTNYPILSNATFNKDASLKYSIIVDADLNKTGFQFILSSSNKIDAEKYHFSANAIGPSGKTYSQIANFLSSKSTDNKNIYELTLPLPETGKYQVNFTAYEGQSSDQKIVDQQTLTVEIVPEGPSKNEAFVYAIPFILVAFIGIKIFIHKNRKIA